MKQTKIISQFKLKPKGWQLILICVVFIIPFILGSTLYFFRESVTFKTTAKGEILAPKQAHDVLHIATENYLGKWQLLYLLPSACDATCQHNKRLLRNLCTALGKDEKRVILRNVSFETSDASSGFVEGSVIIVDPKGWLVTHYPPSHFYAKAILEDLRRLMRYSYVG